MQVDQYSILWVIVAIVFAVAEMILPSFGCIFGSLGALVAAGFALSPSVSIQVQIAIFSVSTLLGLVFLRPKLMAKMKKSQGVPSRTEALLGKQGVMKDGRVLIEGNDWAVKNGDGLEDGIKVEVTGASGIVLEVRKA